MTFRIVDALRSAVAIAAMCATLPASSAPPAQSATAAGHATTETLATVEQPRPFGYVIGDLVTQRVLLQSANSVFEPAAPPTAQRLNVWLERRTPRIESTAEGRKWLIVDYQVTNAPQSLTTVNLPAWTLESKSGATVLKIPAWPISVAPLTPRSAFTTDGFGELRPDRAAPVVATSAIRRQLIFWSVAFALTVVLWLAWVQWRNWRETMHRPFAGALREIRSLDETAPQAWQALHRAFDRTAGRVTQVETLPALFERAPHLEPLRPQIERFFTQSSERFFGAGPPAAPLSVRALCHELRRLEKRHGP